MRGRAAPVRADHGATVGAEAAADLEAIGAKWHRALERLAAVLATQGYEPRLNDDRAVVLANCPFDSLARKHTALVCRLNQSYVQGVADGLECDAVASLEPSPGHYCVTAREVASMAEKPERE